jgi:hypothetical protein
MKKIIVIINLLIFMVGSAYSAMYYCDFEGSNGIGTKDSPFNTIANAMSSMIKGDTLYCRGTTNAEQSCSKGVEIYGNDRDWLNYEGGNNRAEISNSGGNGITLSSSADNTKIDGFNISSPTENGIRGNGAREVEVSNNIIINTGGTWIYLAPQTNQNCRRWLIHNNSYNGSGLVNPESGYGVTIFWSQGQDCDSTKIYNNDLKNCAEDAIRLVGKEIHIYGNYIYKWGTAFAEGDQGILVFGNSNIDTYNIYIYNNIIAEGIGDGIQFYASGEYMAGEFYVQNNSFYNIHKGTEGAGGHAIANIGIGSATKCVITNNIIRNCGNELSNPGSNDNSVDMRFWNAGSQVFFYNNIIQNDNRTEVIQIYDNFNSGDSDRMFTVSEAEAQFVHADNNAQVIPGWVDITPEDDIDDYKPSSPTANGAAVSKYPGKFQYSETSQKGINEYLYPTDFNGQKRQSFGNWDMGALRYNSDSLPPIPPKGFRKL